MNGFRNTFDSLACSALGRTRAALASGLVLVGAGCAPALTASGIPPGAEVQRYELRLARDSSNLQVLVPLAAAYREAGRVAEARPLLERAVAQQPNEPGAVLLLGLTYEDQGRLEDAAELYDRYARLGRSPRLRSQMRGRARLVRRQAWIESARSAVAQEAALAAAAPAPRSVAVFPFQVREVQPELQPLGRALAELVVTDLSQVDRIRVLERLRVQLLLDEIRLAEEGLVDPATAARGGRLLGAERIVQGSLAGSTEALRLEAAVVRVTGELEGARGPVVEQDAARRFFDLQKRLVFSLFESLGIQLTPAEQARIARRPTQHLQALLSFGTGLEAEDIGAFANAAQHFRHAAALDPDFSLARSRAEIAEQAAAAGNVVTQQLTEQAFAEFGAVAAALASVEELVPDAGGRDAASEALGQEGIGTGGAVLRIIVRPR